MLGVRHHGPGSARAVGRALDTLDPVAVVIEGPVELDAVAALAGLASMRPPIAALTYVPDQPRRASFYPMASFSPEWVALRWALAHGRVVRFADLPAANQLARPPGDGDHPGDRARANPDGADPARADPLATLAAAAGFDDPERWWEDAVELHHRGLDAFDAVMDAMIEVRASTGELDSDLLREAAMRRVLRATLAAVRADASGGDRSGGDRSGAGVGVDGTAAVVMVCGAWHAPALRRDRWPSAASDNARLQNLPRTKVAATWVPWTSRRLSYASGYGAGVASPGWYHHLFTAPDQPVARWLVRTARLLRREELATSPAAVVEATRLAETLAVLRGRPLAGLTEVSEATQAVLCGGSAIPMSIVGDRLLVGDDMGRVPPETPMIPLARDLADTQRRLRLKPSPVATTLELDLRLPSHRERSALFHRLGLLGIGWAEPADTGRTTGTFREAWRLEWRPELALAVIEAGGTGTTVAAATTDAVAQQATTADIATLCRLVEQALPAELPEALDTVMAALGERAARQHDVVRLMASVEPLARATRYGDVRGIDTVTLASVLTGIVTRVAIGLPPAATALDDDAAHELRRHLDSVHRGLAALDDGPLRGQWLDSLESTLARTDTHGLIAGRSARILLDGGRLGGDDAAIRLSRSLSTASPPIQAAAFLEGFLAGDAMLLLHDQVLLQLIDGWVAGVADEAFDDVLPLLRRAFSVYQPAERRVIGEAVGRRDPNRPTGAGTTGASMAGTMAGAEGDIDLDRAAQVEPVLRLLLGLAPGVRGRPGEDVRDG